MKAIIRFTRAGGARYLGHLDTLRAMQRLLRRAKLPIVYTAGFNPHPRLSFAAASPVGLLSEYEVMEVPISEEPSEMLDALNRAAPEGMAFMEYVIVEDAAPAPMAAVDASRYRVTLSGDLADATAFLLNAPEVRVNKRTKSGEKEVDIRPMIRSLTAEVSGGVSVIDMLLEHRGEGALRPELVVDALGAVGGGGARAARTIERTVLYAGGKPMMEFYKALERRLTS